jgi:hypothetical protein
MELSQATMNQLMDIVKMVMVGMMDADGSSGPVNMMRELKAATDYMLKARRNFEGNPIVEQIVDTMTADRNLLYDEGQQVNLGVVGYEQIFNAVSSIDGLLGVNQDAYGFKVFLYELAEVIAQAAGGGIFGTGDKVTESEGNFLFILQARLGLH